MALSTGSAFRVLISAFCMLTAGMSSRSSADVSPAQWLATQPKPLFRSGYTLPRLTRYGWSLAVDARIELTENWGYALEFGGYVGLETVARLDDPSSAEAITAALSRADPQKYPLAVICSRQLPGTEAPPETWVRDADGKVINGQGVSMDGNVWSEEAGALFSPEAPDTVWKMAGEYRAAPFRALQSRGVPISIVLNGGEYGIGVLGAMQSIWSMDPKIAAAVSAEYAIGGNWRTYASKKKANAEHIIADAVRTAVPQRDLYVYYAAGGGTLRNTYWGIDDWGFYWADMRGTGDLPSSEIYYKHFNDGFTGTKNILSLALNAVGPEIASGNPLSYNWICAGWPRGDEAVHLADINRWTGFLKCYYTAGMIGANVGYYDFPTGGFDAAFATDAPPAWLRQMVASSHVHALFSQLEGFVRASDLLPGPMPHSISTSDAAYEFPTNDETARVLVRKHRTSSEWLLAAWACDGADRSVQVLVPELGQVTLQARVCGSVYRATLSGSTVTLIRIDEEGSTFTQGTAGAPQVSTVDLAVAPPSASERLLWLAADTGVTTDSEGKVSAWASRGTPALTMQQADASKRPAIIADAISGKPALRFSNSQSWLEIPNLGTAGDAFTGAITLFSIFTGGILNGDNRIISATILNGADWLGGKGFKLTDGVVDLAELKNGIALKIVNGSLDTSLQSIYIGVMGPGYGGFSGDLAEVIVYKGSLPPTKSTLVIQYLTDKYRLDASVPTGLRGNIGGIAKNPSTLSVRHTGGIVEIRVHQTSAVRRISIIDPMGRVLATQQGSNNMRIARTRMGPGTRFAIAEDRMGHATVMSLIVP